MNRLRVILYTVVLFLYFAIFIQISSIFIITPRRDAPLMRVFNDNLAIIEQHCNKNQYTPPNSVTTVMFADLTEEIAFCRRKLNGFEIVFDKHYWERILDATNRKQVMIHEMVHCMFDQRHVADERHFMAEFFQPMSELTLNNQIEQYLNSKCKQK